MQIVNGRSLLQEDLFTENSEMAVSFRIQGSSTRGNIILDRWHEGTTAVRLYFYNLTISLYFVDLQKNWMQNIHLRIFTLILPVLLAASQNFVNTD